MGKYLEVFRIGIKEQMAYRFDMITTSLFAAFKILLAYILWKAVFNGRELIGDYTFAKMMTYYLFVSFAVQMNKGQDVVFQFSGEIRSGQFSKYVVRPISPVGVFNALAISKTAVVFVINIFAFAIWIMLLTNILYVPSILNTILALIFLMIGLLITYQLYYLITMFSFKIIAIGGLLFAVMNIISFLSGELVPLDLLPSFVESIVRMMPFYYTIYFPASILLDVNTGQVMGGFIIQMVWLFGLFTLNQMMYKKLFTHYEGVGV